MNGIGRDEMGVKSELELELGEGEQETHIL